VTQEIILVD